MNPLALFTIRAWEQNVRQSQTASVWKCDTIELQQTIFQSATVRPTYLIFFSSSDRTTWKCTGLARVTSTTAVPPIQWRTTRFVVDPGTTTFPISWVVAGARELPRFPQNGQLWGPQRAHRVLCHLLACAPASGARDLLRQEMGPVMKQAQLVF
jgi:hypothetical protein